MDLSCFLVQSDARVDGGMDRQVEGGNKRPQGARNVGPQEGRIGGFAGLGTSLPALHRRQRPQYRHETVPHQGILNSQLSAK